MTASVFSLFNAKGRKYLSAEERARFLVAVRQEPRLAVQTFALTLAHTGRRIDPKRFLPHLDHCQTPTAPHSTDGEPEQARSLAPPEKYYSHDPADTGAPLPPRPCSVCGGGSEAPDYRRIAMVSISILAPGRPKFGSGTPVAAPAGSR